VYDKVEKERAEKEMEEKAKKEAEQNKYKGVLDYQVWLKGWGEERQGD